MEAADEDPLLAARCYLAVRGVDLEQATLAQVVGALQEVRYRQTVEALIKRL